MKDRKQTVRAAEAVTVHIGTEHEWLAAASTDGAEWMRYEFTDHSNRGILYESLCRISLVRHCIKMKHESSLSTNYVTGSIHLCGFPSLSLNFTCVQLTPTSSSSPSFQTVGQMQQPKINRETDDITRSTSTYHPKATFLILLRPISAALSLETPRNSTRFVKSTTVNPDCNVKQNGNVCNDNQFN
jgi:hypothetical protein